MALSALLTTTMTMMKTVIGALEKAGIRDKTKVMIGGAPITQQFAEEIGADGFSDNASSAVAVARRLVPRLAPRLNPPVRLSRQRYLRVHRNVTASQSARPTSAK